MTYVASPQKTYVVQPKEGEINYDLVHKNKIEQFYNKVMSQDITEHKVQKKKTTVTTGRSQPGELPSKKKIVNRLTMTTRVCKRAVARIITFVHTRLGRMISDVNRDFDPADIEHAMAHPETQQVVQKYIANEGIKLRHRDSNAEVFAR